MQICRESTEDSSTSDMDVNLFLEVINPENLTEDFCYFSCACSFLPEQAQKTGSMLIQLSIEAVLQVDV